MKIFKTSFLWGLAAFLISSWSLAEAQQNQKNEQGVQKITANYQVKAGFFPLPIQARIAVEQIDHERYQASIVIKSPVFKVDQQEVAQIRACKIELLEVRSEGDRVGVDSWNEQIHITWPTQEVHYQNGEYLKQSYAASHTPTGFVSFFAHQYSALLRKQQKRITLLYIQSAKAWPTSFIFKGKDASVENAYFREARDAYRFVTPRKDMDEADMPTVWYVPDTLAAFPLRMSMKLGVFRVEVKLKEISASPEQIKALFAGWQCGS